MKHTGIQHAPHRRGGKRGGVARLALAVALLIAGLSGLTAVATAAAQSAATIALTVQPWLCPAGYEGATSLRRRLPAASGSRP